MIPRSIVALAGLFGLAGAAMAGALEERPDLMQAFAAQGARGTFVLYDAAAGRTIAADAERAEQPFVPGSTFKIAHALIALETGAIADQHEILPYGGLPQPVRAWERDMNLAEAVRVSNVAIFQEVARKIGVSRMEAMLDRLDYGNRRLGDVIDRFWLDGPLEISAVEQARFLARLATGKLPVSERGQAIVRDLLRLERKGAAALYGKTGWHDAAAPQLGWWVGWVERGSQVHAFALNIDMASAVDAPKREAIGRALLAKLGVY